VPISRVSRRKSLTSGERPKKKGMKPVPGTFLYPKQVAAAVLSASERVSMYSALLQWNVDGVVAVLGTTTLVRRLAEVTS